jgi:hypothetical protein
MRGLARVVGGALVAATTLIAAPNASAVVRPADRAATHAYLLAEYEYNQAVLAAQSAATAAVDTAVSQIGSECSGVLAAAPRPSVPKAPPRQAPSPRRQGEENRLRTQVDALESELGATLELAARQPTRAAESSLASKLARLRWSDRRITLLVHYTAQSIEQGAVAQPPVCADMRAWVASGYRILSPASKVLVEHREAELVHLLLLSVPELLLSGMARFNGPAEDALERRLDALRRRVTDARSSEQAAYERVRSAIGLAPREGEEPKARRRKIRPPVEVGGGKTASGSRYAVWVRVHSGFRGCEAGVEVRQGERVNASDCIPGFGPRQPTVKCVRGLLTIDLVTAGAVRSVELRLSDGTRIASRPIRVSARLGGPAGVYYQQVRGPAPVPVALVELGARGHRLHEFKLERLMGCTKHPFKYLPGGFRVLARGREPQGPRFAIMAEHYRLFGVVYFKLRFAEGVQANQLRRTREPEGPSEEIFEGEEEGEAGEAVPGRSGRIVALPFQAHVESGCHPYEHSLIYGLLRSRRDRVFVKVAGLTHQLRRVPIPAEMRAGYGALAYGAFASSPEEMVVRAPDGRVVLHEDRRSEAKDQREMCEGEAEGAGPTVGQDGGTIIFAGAAI